MGAMIHNRVQMIVGGKEPLAPEDKLDGIAKSCYTAAGIYTILLFFCGCQWFIHSKESLRRPRRMDSSLTVQELHH